MSKLKKKHLATPPWEPPTRLCICGDGPVAGKGAKVVDADLVVQLQAVQGRYRGRQCMRAGSLEYGQAVLEVIEVAVQVGCGG